MKYNTTADSTPEQKPWRNLRYDLSDIAYDPHAHHTLVYTKIDYHQIRSSFSIPVQTAVFIHGFSLHKSTFQTCTHTPKSLFDNNTSYDSSMKIPLLSVLSHGLSRTKITFEFRNVDQPEVPASTKISSPPGQVFFRISSYSSFCIGTLLI